MKQVDEVIPNNLPAQLNRFIGRERQLEQVEQLIESHRLVTLTGSGGSGKTRLALQAASDLLDRYGDGVYLVELSSLIDPAEVAGAVAKILGITVTSHKSVIATLTDVLFDKSMLLVLDNCEHVVAGCAILAAGLLRYTRRVHIVATSREILAVAGEAMWPVPPLATPDPKQLPALENFSLCESVQLFVERARAANPEFCVTQENAPAIAEICSRLDGIPLAVELAAARVSVLSPENIADRLGDRFRFLAGRSRTALPRQQTLRALVDWSYDLLSDGERISWRRLSVFIGTFSLEAATSVISDDDADAWDVLEYLTRLVEKSILGTVSTVHGTYYRLLETIRAYGAEKLHEAGELAVVRQRWWTYYAEFATLVRTQTASDDWSYVDVQGSNLQASWSAAVDAGDAVSAVKLAATLGNYYFRLGEVATAREKLRQTLSLCDGTDFVDEYCLALAQAGILASFDRDQAESRRLLGHAIDVMSHHVVSPEVKKSVFLYAGQVWMLEPERARGYFEECLTLVRGTPAEAQVWMLLATVKFVEGRWGQGDQLLDRADQIPEVSLYQKASSRSQRAAGFGLRGDWAKARTLVSEAVDIFKQLRVVPNLIQAQILLALAQEHMGDREESELLMIEALTAAVDGNIALGESLNPVAGWMSLRGLLAESVALLAGAGETSPALREAWGDSVMATARAGMPDDRIAAAQEMGRALGVAKASRYALAAAHRAKSQDSLTNDFSEHGNEPTAVRTKSIPLVAVPSREQGDDSALIATRSMNRVSLADCTVIGNYRRYDERVRNQLRDWQGRIAAPLRGHSTVHENFLIWAAPGSGKSFLIQETARALGADVSYVELNLARLGREDWVEGLRVINELDKPVLVLLDEIDARADVNWPYEDVFSLLDLNLNENRSAVFVLIGSSTTHIDGMVANMLKRSKAKDMLDRVPMDRRFEIAAPVLEDKAVILFSQILGAAAARGQQIDEVEKLAVYYALTDESFQTPRQLRDLAVAAVQRLPHEEQRLTYDDLFYRGDARNHNFWMSHAEAARDLSGLFVRIEG